MLTGSEEVGCSSCGSLPCCTWHCRWILGVQAEALGYGCRSLGLLHFWMQGLVGLDCLVMSMFRLWRRQEERFLEWMVAISQSLTDLFLSNSLLHSQVS